jgi:hypothetical protein
MRGLKRQRSAHTIAAGHALIQNLRRGHYDIATDVPDRHRLRAAFDDLAPRSSGCDHRSDGVPGFDNATEPPELNEHFRCPSISR